MEDHSHMQTDSRFSERRKGRCNHAEFPLPVWAFGSKVLPALHTESGSSPSHRSFLEIPSEVYTEVYLPGGSRSSQANDQDQPPQGGPGVRQWHLGKVA